jgi:hypothetical protein
MTLDACSRLFDDLGALAERVDAADQASATWCEHRVGAGSRVEIDDQAPSG